MRWAVRSAAISGRKQYVYAQRTWSGAWAWHVNQKPRTSPRDPFHFMRIGEA